MKHPLVGKNYFFFPFRRKKRDVKFEQTNTCECNYFLNFYSWTEQGKQEIRTGGEGNENRYTYTQVKAMAFINVKRITIIIIIPFIRTP